MPTLESAQVLALFFNVSLDWLSGNEEKTETSDSEDSEIGYVDISTNFSKLIKKAVENNISCKQLEEAVDFLIKLRT